MRKKRAIILCFVLLAGITNHILAQETNQITCTGKVVDDQERPVAGAKVALHVIAHGQTAYSYEKPLLQ